MVKIVGNQESTIDYPGKMGQILFLEGCNFRCGFCHSHELLNVGVVGINEEQLVKKLVLKARRGWYEGVIVSGGEPTIYEDLPEFLERLKGLGLAVKLDTNGSNPLMLERLLDEGNVDYIAMDIKSPREKYLDIVGCKIDLENLDKSIMLIKRFPNYEFRTTILPFLNEEDFEAMGEWVSKDEKVQQYTLQQFEPKNAFDESYREMKPKFREEVLELSKVMEKYANKVRVLI